MAGVMKDPLPKGFIDLNAAYYTPKSQNINVIGVVIDFLPPVMSKGSDYVMTFELRDLSNASDGKQGIGLKIKVFRRSVELMPKISSVGDVVILRDVRTQTYAGAPLIITPPTSKQIVFHDKTIPVPDSSDAYRDKNILAHFSTPAGHQPTKEEQLYAIELHHLVSLDTKPLASSGAAHGRPSMSATPATNGGLVGQTSHAKSLQNQSAGTTQTPHADWKFKLLQDVEDHRFYNLVGEVVKFYPSGNVQIYISDYTTNSLFFNYKSDEEYDTGQVDYARDGDAYGYVKRPTHAWKGPPGKMSLQITLWQPHGSWALSNVQEGEIYIFRNVHIKYNGGLNVLEGAIHTDQRRPEQIGIEQVTIADSRVRDLLERKEIAKRPEPPKPVKLTKGQKRRQQKQRVQKKQEQAKKIALPANQTTLPVDGIEPREIIRSGHHTIPISSITSILQSPHRTNNGPNNTTTPLPFINARFRARVRVIDFDPPNLEDFAQSLDTSTSPYNDQATQTSSMSDTVMYTGESIPSGPGWEWAFRLLVEDAGPLPASETAERLPLIVSGSDAEYLLKLTATDLRHDKKTFNKLKERLFLLWGNLEEIKTAESQGLAQSQQLSSNAFECCVQEYGVRAAEGNGGVGGSGNGWVRLFKMFQTTIVAG